MEYTATSKDNESTASPTILQEGPLLLRKGDLLFFEWTNSLGKLIFTWEKLHAELRSNYKLYLFGAEKRVCKILYLILLQDVPDDVIQIDSTTLIEDVDIISITGKDYAFTITSTKYGYYLFCAPSESDKSFWLKILRQVISVEPTGVIKKFLILLSNLTYF